MEVIGVFLIEKKKVSTVQQDAEVEKQKGSLLN